MEFLLIWLPTGQQVDAESGNVVVHLIHEPTNKNGTTRASFGGANDVEINFPVTIQ